MLKLLRRVFKSLLDPSRGFKERVFIFLTPIAVIVALVALIVDIYTGEDISEIIALIVTVTSVPMITFISVRTNKINLAARLVVLGLVFVLLPVLFYFGGGPYGGGVIWIVFAYLYTGLVLSGLWKPVMLVVITVETMFFYIDSFFHQWRLVKHEEAFFYVDSMTSIILVGIVCCLMVWFEEWLFNEEKKRTIAETKKVENLVQSQSRFFSSMSHEIRTPINSILGLNEIILRQEDASDEIVKDSNNIQGAGRMLLALVNDILDVSKIEAGKMDIVPVNYNLGTMLSDIVNMVLPRTEEKGLEFNVEIDPKIPAELFGDEVRLKQILINLLNNAVKYTKEGSVTLNIEKEDYSGEEVLLMMSVTDTGMGIKQEALPYLFDAFQRIDEENISKIEGTGLGLYIVKMLVTMMDGKITVNSVYTQGSTFMVTLRQKVTKPDAIGDVNVMTLGEEGNRRSKFEPSFTAPGARVLIVDDNEMNLKVESKLLERTLLQIDTAISGVQALSLTISEHYDIILMDHLMPEMDGIECMQNIRLQQGGLNHHTPVVVVTANAGSENRALYNSCGFDGYLVKPVRGKEMEEMILKHISEIKVKRNYSVNLSSSHVSTSVGYKKKIPILITTDSMCDLPKSVLDDYGIIMVPFWIRLGDKRYLDRIEASADEVSWYIKSGIGPESEAPSVEEYERFFGEGIKNAHEVIHISLMSGVSNAYENACKAARAYENVHVYDSGYNASALGVQALMAHRLTLQGRTVNEIITGLDRFRKNIQSSFVTDDIRYLAKRQNVRKIDNVFMSIMGFGVMLNIREGKLKVGKILGGDRRSMLERYVLSALECKRVIDPDMIIIDYVELSQEDKEFITELIKGRCNFEHIYFIKASAVMTVNCSVGALGITYLTKSEQAHNISQMLLSLEEEYEPDDTDDEYDVSVPKKVAVAVEEPEEIILDRELLWYENIEGIDPEVAMTNCGSEDTLKTMMSIFYESIASRVDEIEGFYRSEDWENYTIKVHALKSSSRLIGAVKLGDEAEKLEFAGKEGNVGLIREKTEILLADLKAYKDILGHICAPQTAVEVSSDEEVDSFLLECAYDAIKEGAQNKDHDMIAETLDELSDYKLSQDDQDKMERISGLLSDGDYDSIIAVVAE